MFVYRKTLLSDFEDWKLSDREEDSLQNCAMDSFMVQMFKGSGLAYAKRFTQLSEWSIVTVRIIIWYWDIELRWDVFSCMEYLQAF